jgi:uncharacterized membrane protein YdbT with pleckstrin-like domain
MSYAESVLQPGETILMVGRLHWIIYRWAILVLVGGGALTWLAYEWPASEDFTVLMAMVFAMMFAATFGYAWFIRWITEFAVTSHRVIASRVFIARNTEEMSVEKVETVDVAQSVLGRILGYGNLRITGTGGTNDIRIARMAEPFALRNAIIVRP